MHEEVEPVRIPLHDHVSKLRARPARIEAGEGGGGWNGEKAEGERCDVTVLVGETDQLTANRTTRCGLRADDGETAGPALSAGRVGLFNSGYIRQSVDWGTICTLVFLGTSEASLSEERTRYALFYSSVQPAQ